MKLRAAFFSVVPSPYQRDLFRALAARPEVAPEVFYLEKAAPDSPWPERVLANYERVLPGRWFALGSRRIHANWPLPRLEDFDVVVLNTLMSATAQWLLRGPLRARRWIFWGEKLIGSGWLHRALSAPLRRAAAIAAIGSWAERDYAARFPAQRVANLPYHCDLAAFLAQPRPARRDGTTTFFFCGQMIARKGVDTLLAAFAQLNARARLRLVGREAELPQMLAALPRAVAERIDYAGFCAPEELPAQFAQADVFVLPSRHDGWGVVVNQALGAGRPILCSDAVGAGYDLVEEGVNGAVFPAGDVAALAAAMRRFLDEPPLAETWGAASRERAAEWSPERGAARWVELLQEVAAR